MSTTSSSQPDCVLLSVNANPGQVRNDSTASTTTSNHNKIEVSLCPAQPPLPSKLYVHCPDLALTERPRVLRAVGDRFLLRVDVDCRPDGASSPDKCDYFIYRAGNGREPSLQRLAHPIPFFHEYDVGLLNRGAKYTLAVLIATGTPAYELRILHSENPAEWIYREVTVTEPQRRLPLVVPENCGRLLYHDTSTVISIGGEGGTMGWVDLWSGILLCDVLSDEPTLREVPMPMPLDLVSCDNGRGTELGCPVPFRGIAFVPDGDCLKLVHMEANATLVPGNNSDDVGPNFQMHHWTIVTYTNTAMTNSWKDWHRDCRVEASDITMDDQIKSQLLQSGLLGSAQGQALHNLLVSHPAPDVSSAAAHEGVVYLMARKKYEHPDVWVLAVDTKNKTLLGATEFATECKPSVVSEITYCPSAIANHIKPDIHAKRRMLPLGMLNNDR